MVDMLPHNLDAERSLLGALLVRPESWSDVRDVVGPDDFYRHAHRVIFERLEGLQVAGKALDMVALVDVLQRTGELESVGGLGYLTALSGGTSRGMARPDDHAAIVHEHALRRQCVVIAEQLRSEALASDDVESARTNAERALRELQTGTSTTTVTAADAVADAIDTLESYERVEHLGVTGVPTGIYSLDDMLGGWQRTDLVVIAARPSVGKTAFAGQVAAYAAVTRRVPTLFATNEQKPGALSLRMASNRARVNIENARKQRLRDDELERLSDALKEIREAPLTFMDARGKRMSDVRRQARWLKARGQLELLVFDYLGLCVPEVSQSRSETRERQVAVQSGLAKGIASELNIPVLLLCQLNREFEKEQPKGKKAAPRRPRLSDLRESGAVEQDADVVMFVHRPFARPSNPEEATREGQTELIVAKHRNGRIGDINAHYAKHWVRFEEVA